MWMVTAGVRFKGFVWTLTFKYHVGSYCGKTVFTLLCHKAYDQLQNPNPVCLHIVCLMVYARNTLPLCWWMQLKKKGLHLLLSDRCTCSIGVVTSALQSVCVCARLPAGYRQPCLWHLSCSGLCLAPRSWPPVCYHANNTSPSLGL